MSQQAPDEFEEAMTRLLNEPRPPWKPGAYYCKDGDLLEALWSPESYYAVWLNERVTLLKDQKTNEVVGCQITGLSVVLGDK